jgi:hypothetical protein
MLPPEKLQDYDRYPLAHRAGLIHNISEEMLSMDLATIINVNFLGLFPKSLLAVLQNYKQSLKKDLQAGFDECINQLLSAVIYQLIVIQHIIHDLFVAIKLQIEEEGAGRQQASSKQESTYTNALPKVVKMINIKQPAPRICRANKFHLLLAKGIIHRPMICAELRHMCSECICEGTRQRKDGNYGNLCIKSYSNPNDTIPLPTNQH